MQLPKAPQHGRKDGREHHRKTGQPQGAARRTARVLRHLLNASQRIQHGARFVRHAQPQCGGQRLPAFAREQRRAQRVFQIGDGLAGAGLGHAHLSRRMRDIAGVRHGQHQPPVHQVHHGISPAYSTFLKK
ncbi:hypothetical protein D3C73_1249920 [compost metagenome]